MGGDGERGHSLLASAVGRGDSSPWLPSTKVSSEQVAWWAGPERQTSGRQSKNKTASCLLRPGSSGVSRLPRCRSSGGGPAQPEALLWRGFIDGGASRTPYMPGVSGEPTVQGHIAQPSLLALVTAP